MPASPADVAHVRAAFEEFNARFAELDGPALDDYFARIYDDDAVLENVDSFPLPARYQGLAGYHQWFEETYSPYEGVSWKIDDVRAAGERVLALVRVSGRPKGDTMLLEVAVGCLYDMKGGRISHARVYLGHERALAAADQ